jgi:hypothetical protein
MSRPKSFKGPSSPIRRFVLMAVVLTPFLGIAASSQAASSVVAPPPPVDIKKYFDAMWKAHREEFLKQKDKDTLIKVTDNSFLDASFRPVPGAAVLLVAGVKRWEDAHPATSWGVYGYNRLHFEVTRGSAQLMSITALVAGQSDAGQAGSLKRGLDGSLAWVLLPSGSTETVRVEASFIDAGERADFQSADKLIFDIKPDGQELGRNGRLNDYVRMEYANKRKNEKLVFQDDRFYADANGNPLPKAVHYLSRSVHVDGKFHVQHFGSGMIPGMRSTDTFDSNFADQETWDLTLPKRLTHQGPGKRFAVVKSIGGGLQLVRIYNEDTVDLGPETSINLCDQKGMLMDLRTDYSQPVNDQGYRHWARWEKVSPHGGGQNAEIQVMNTKVLSAPPQNWQSVLAEGQ